MNELIQVTKLPCEINVEKIVSILSYPNWNKLLQVIDYTRSYEQGLEIGIVLLDLLDAVAGEIDKKQYDEFITSLYSFHLSNLDKLDRWEEYIETWNKIRANTDYTYTYAHRARDSHGSEIEPFIIREDKQSLYVHFLWGGYYRKKVIERKLSRGKHDKRMYHATQAELSTEEVVERFDWIMKFLETGECDFNSPASRQRKEKQEAKKRTVDLKKV